MATLDTDWVARLRSRIYTEFLPTNFPLPFSVALGTNANAFQACVAALAYVWSIDPITNDATSPAYGVGRGVQLDRIGLLLNQPRAGSDDPTYRLYLRAKIRIDKSDGSVNDLIAVFMAAFPGVLPLYQPGGNASFVMVLPDVVLTDQQAAIALSFLLTAKMAGVRALLQTQGDVDSAMFYTSRAAYFGAPTIIGDTSITTSVNLTAFPYSGGLILDAGTPTAEIDSFANRGDSTIPLLSPMSSAHAVGATIAGLFGKQGKGFPIATFATGSSSVGDGTLDVAATGTFASTGNLWIDFGTATAELAAYTIGDATTFNIPGQLTQSHTANATVVEDTSGGKLARIH